MYDIDDEDLITECPFEYAYQCPYKEGCAHCPLDGERMDYPPLDPILYDDEERMWEYKEEQERRKEKIKELMELFREMNEDLNAEEMERREYDEKE